jgi:O-antigen/teichoic acid export membrane protein
MKIRLSEFTRNTITISKGTVLSQAIVIIATPILTRLYGPDSFGTLALFASGYTILAGIFSARYELSIVLPKDDAGAVKLMRLALSLSLVLSTGLLLVLALAKLTGIATVAGYWLLLPPAIIAGTVYSVYQNWFSRKKLFAVSARSGVINSSVNTAFCFLFLLALPNKGDQLIYAYLAGFAAAALYLALRFHKSQTASWRASRREMISLAREYDHFPRYMLPTTLLGILGSQIIPFLLRQFYPLADVGFYAIANRFLVIPSLLMGAAIAEVFRVDLAEKNNAGLDLGPFFKRTLLKMALIGGPVFAAMMVFAPLAFRLILGQAYGSAGVYARYLCLGVFGQFLIQPFGYIFVVRNRIRIYFAFQLGLTAASVLAIVAGHARFGGIKGSFLLMSGATVVLSGMMLYAASRVARRSRVPEPSR